MNPSLNIMAQQNISKAELLKTIQLPKNLKNLGQRLPRAQYDNYENEVMQNAVQMQSAFSPV